MLLLRSRFPERLLFAIVRNRKGRCRNTLRAVHVEQIGSRLLHSRSRPPCGAPSTTSGRGNRGYPIADWCTGERLVALCLDVEGKRAPVGIEVHAFAVACCGRVDVRARDRRPVLRHRLNAARTQLHRGRLQCSPRAPPQRFPVVRVGRGGRGTSASRMLTEPCPHLYTGQLRSMRRC